MRRIEGAIDWSFLRGEARSEDDARAVIRDETQAKKRKRGEYAQRKNG